MHGRFCQVMSAELAAELDQKEDRSQQLEATLQQKEEQLEQLTELQKVSLRSSHTPNAWKLLLLHLTLCWPLCGRRRRSSPSCRGYFHVLFAFETWKIALCCTSIAPHSICMHQLRHRWVCSIMLS